jgi:hypothetical protein
MEKAVRINVEFPADDVILRGWLYTPQDQKGPFPPWSSQRTALPV